MRLKNVKNAKEIIQNSPYVVLEPKTYKGNWSNLFKNNNNIFSTNNIRHNTNNIILYISSKEKQ